jgi:hypothetical protein
MFLLYPDEFACHALVLFYAVAEMSKYVPKKKEMSK